MDFICKRCNETKDRSDFPKKAAISWCKQCHSSYAKEWQRANPEKAALAQRRSDLKRKYGISLERYEEMLAEQAGGCALCGAGAHDSRGGRLAVDHDAATGRVRGLLCGPCNTGIGKLQHSPELLHKAAAYVA